jgi:hypothetical protein
LSLNRTPQLSFIRGSVVRYVQIPASEGPPPPFSPSPLPSVIVTLLSLQWTRLFFKMQHGVRFSSSPPNSTKLDKTRQDETTLYSPTLYQTRQDKTRRDKTIYSNPTPQDLRRIHQAQQNKSR